MLIWEEETCLALLLASSSLATSRVEWRRRRNCCSIDTNTFFDWGINGVWRELYLNVWSWSRITICKRAIITAASFSLRAEALVGMECVRLQYGKIAHASKRSHFLDLSVYTKSNSLWSNKWDRKNPFSKAEGCMDLESETGSETFRRNNWCRKWGTIPFERGNLGDKECRVPPKQNAIKEN